MKIRSAAVMTLALSLGAGCGGDDSPGSAADANSADGTDAGSGTCDPLLQDCPSGQRCTSGCRVAGVMAKVFTCAVSKPGAMAIHGQDCGVGCAPGHDCFMVPAGDGGTRSVCRKYCSTNADCPTNDCLREGLVCSPGDLMPIGRVCAL